MRKLIALLALAPVLAQADILVVGPRDSYRRLSTPCVNKKVLEHILPSHQANFKAGVLVFEGKEYASCWVEHNGMVFSVDEKGDLLQPLPAGAFRDDSI